MSDDIARTIAALERATDPSALSAAFREALKAVKANAQIYPPELPGQRYVRTYVLRDGWQYSEPQATPDGLRGDVYNDVPYAPDVMGPGTQEAFFIDRWRTTDDIADEMAGMVEAILEAAYRRQVTL